MFLNEPGRTRYDLNFVLFGFPVRVHPAFLVLPLVLGSSLLQSPNYNAGIVLLMLIVIFFVSILVHELGHALAFRAFGQSCHIVIYWMGGLAIPGSGDVWNVRRKGLTPVQHIIVSLAGPGLGFAFAGALVALIYGLGGSVIHVQHGIFPLLFADLRDSVLAESPQIALLALFFDVMLFANVFINVLNLIPVFPLDGGQVARQLFTLSDPGNGMRYSLISSVIVGAIVAVASFRDDRFMAFFFAFMAWSNFMTLQQMGSWGGPRRW